MPLLEDIATLEARVKILLERNASLRDNDAKLMLDIWKQDGMEANLKSLWFFEAWFMNATPPESIRRTRQLVQEKYPALRGKSWNSRHKQGDLIREEIIKIKGGKYGGGIA